MTCGRTVAKYGAFAHTAAENNRVPAGLEDSFFHMVKVGEGAVFASGIEDMKHTLVVGIKARVRTVELDKRNQQKGTTTVATVEINQSNFQDTISAEGIVLLDFWAEWCGPCQRFGPIFEQVSEEFPEHTFGKVDTEANQELSAALQIQSIPTLMMFRDGILLAREQGLLPPAALQELITKAQELDMDDVRKQVAAAQTEAENSEG